MMVESNNEAVASILNDLILVNNDRIKGYHKALKELDDNDNTLKEMFGELATESSKYREELSRQVVALGGDATTGTTVSGKIHRMWMEMKIAFKGKDSKTALEMCEFGEDATQRAYAAALDADVDFPPEIRKMILSQKSMLRTSHDLVKNCRDLLKK